MMEEIIPPPKTKNENENEIENEPMEVLEENPVPPSLPQPITDTVKTQVVTSFEELVYAGKPKALPKTSKFSNSYNFAPKPKKASGGGDGAGFSPATKAILTYALGIASVLFVLYYLRNLFWGPQKLPSPPGPSSIPTPSIPSVPPNAMKFPK